MVNHISTFRPGMVGALVAALASLGGCYDYHPYPVPFATRGDLLARWDGRAYQPLFLKGVNLGVAVPGTLAGEMAATTEQYDRWFDQIRTLGANAIRTYTLHFPRFYEQLVKHNLAHPEHPLYVLAGAWLDEDDPTRDLFAMTAGFEENLHEAVDCAHGHCTIPERQGRAFGGYEYDLSPWIIGWVIGREVFPDELDTTNAAHAEHTSFTGQALSLANGNPTEVWFTERLDYLIRYERQHYLQERPVSVSSWPTLDPLHHPTEPMSSHEDTEQIDFANLDLHLAPAGYFASYHAYPYYPNFMVEDPGYLQVSDELGVDSYLGYLRDLKAHYANMPLLVAEFGVPASWGNAHTASSGMNHGGHDELQQGLYGARMLKNIYDTHCAGAMLFAWIDEWWKRTWIVDDLAMPLANYKLWHNLTSPEQNFGLIAFDVGAPDYSQQLPVTGTGRLRALNVATDAEYFHVKLTLASPLGAAEALTIGFDTYGDDLGENVLPNGVKTVRRHELALTASAAGAQLFVTQAYDLLSIWHGTAGPEQLFHSIPTSGAPWDPVRWENDGPHDSDDGRFHFPEVVVETGKLRVRTSASTPTSLDAVFLADTTIEVRVPWTLLQVADPTQLLVIDDNRATAGIETRTTDGIGLSVSLGSELLETARFSWSPWTMAPPTTERLKASYQPFQEGLAAIPEQ